MGSESAHTIVVVMVSVANQEEAEKIADLTVRSRLVACASAIPTVRSTYWWEGKIVNDQEALIIMKTTSDKVIPLQEAIRTVHSYKVPEIIAISVEQGFQPYLDWVRSEVS
ncbi:MAG: divalent-cation tolerance protein CutA [Nitrospira sp.]|nr:divalent-cation tolerance protein CutA [Nitrospira sp.]MBS0153809.1 divalent-cation tolerance protein CutA [Nitrospira sp.]MBS0164770.1 divalent-cation tolerance protein CutA [Nitrospira sp.]